MKSYAAYLMVVLWVIGLAGCGADEPVLSDNAELSGLEISAGTLSPAFDATVTDYTASVNFLTPSIQVTPTAADATAMITVNGEAVVSGQASALVTAGLAAITLAAGDNEITVVVTAEDGETTQTYTVDVSRASLSDFGQQAYVKASNPDSGDFFGAVVAIDDDTMVVGADGEGSAAIGIDGDDTDNSAVGSGAAYVFVRDGASWMQQAYLKASNTEAGDAFGITVAIDGDTVVVAAGNEESAATEIDGDQADNSAPNAGAAYVFVRAGETWMQQAYLKASNAEAGDSFSDGFGYGLASAA